MLWQIKYLILYLHNQLIGIIFSDENENDKRSWYHKKHIINKAQEACGNVEFEMIQKVVNI